MRNILLRPSLLRQVGLIMWMAIILAILKVNFSLEQDLKLKYVKSGVETDSICKKGTESLKRYGIVRH